VFVLASLSLGEGEFSHSELAPFAKSVQETRGRGGIRTHGGLPHARFRVECLKPDSATLPLHRKKTPNVERRTSNIECNYLPDEAFGVGR
jgi:hypothetical protein